MVRIYGVTTSNNTSTPASAQILVRVVGISNKDEPVKLTMDGSGEENSGNILSTSQNKALHFVANIVCTTLPDPIQKNASWIISGMLSKGFMNSTVKLKITQALSDSDDTMEDCEVTLMENTSLGGLSIICKGVPAYNETKWTATITGSEV